ncbi:restriction endonuclease subunit S [Methanobacterium aggregans]|uniref:restriction endonuclease subunit S n=1 Tax=Methanobacterium aggregans TaxID=1615586 RepID=UPI001AE92C02|nr:restriction endonuclease subunit S [Methanobacterium aggregans]MBP2045303.1 type I restriction enzyme S subunit [Methanobacterium aggregans]
MSAEGFKEVNIGIMPESWGIKALPNLISHVTDNRGKTAPTSDEGIPLIATNCIKEDALYPTYEKIRFVSKDTYDNWFRSHPKPEDIIIVNKGTPGLVCLVPDPIDFCIAQDMIALRPDKDKIYGRYLFAYMRSGMFKHQVDGLNVGTTIPHLKKTVFKELFIPIPSFSEQKFIGDIYYNLSKKIELNQRMNQTLEEIGRAIFKHWFVDFEFPDEQGRPYKSSGGEMVDSELGEIPKGWKVGKLGSLISITSGKRPDEKSDVKKGIFTVPLVGASSLMGYVNKTLCNEPILVIGRVGTHGVVQRIQPPSFPSDNTLIIKSKYYEFLYQILKTIDYDSLNVGTTQPLITQKSIKNYEIILPNNNILLLFEKIVLGLFNKVNTNNLEIKNLSQIRDSLLPKLMSGKIRVKGDE